MILRILLFSTFLCVFLRAQTFEWVDAAPLDLQTNPAYLHSPVALDNSGSPVSARMINYWGLYGNAYYGDAEIAKRDPSGSSAWKDTIYGKTDVAEIIVDGQNNPACYGTFIDTLVIKGWQLVHTGQESGSFVLKLDSNGNVIWLKDGAQYITGFGVLTALAKDGADNIVIGMSNYPEETDVLVLNPGGTQVSEIVQTNTGTVSDISVDNSGNIWVTGFTFSAPVSFNGLDTIAPFDYNDYVVKYSPSGTPLWVDFIQDVTVQFFQLKTDNAGNGYLAGNLLDSTTFGNIHAHGPMWVYDFFVTKLSPGGTFEWLKELPPGTPGGNLGDAYIGTDNFLSCRGDGQTFLTGVFRHQCYFGGNVTLTPIDYSDLFLISYDTDGNILWGKSAGGDSYDQGGGVAADEYGNCYLTGLVSNNFVFDTLSGTGSTNNLFIAKLNYEAASDVESGKNINPEGFALYQNYPNPFNPTTTISFSLKTDSKVTLNVYNVLGQEVSSLINNEMNAGEHSIKFNALSMPSGIYFYKLEAKGTNGSNFSSTKKMMLLK